MNWFTSRPTYYTASPGAAWGLIVLGILAVAAGIIALIWPGITLVNLIWIFAWFAIISGIVEIFHAFTGDRSMEGRFLLGLRGVVSIVIGFISLVVPGVTLAFFIGLIAAYFIITGIAQIIASFRGHLHPGMLLWGIVGVIAGIIAIAVPGAAALTIAIVFGVYAILGGISAIASGIHILRSGSSDSSGLFGHHHARAS